MCICEKLQINAWPLDKYLSNGHRDNGSVPIPYWTLLTITREIVWFRGSGLISFPFMFSWS